MSLRWLVVLALVALTASSARAADAEATRRRALDLMGQGTQTTLPGAKPAAAGTTPSPPPAGGPRSPRGSGAGSLLFYVLAGVVVLLLVLGLARAFLAGERTARVAVVPAGESADDRAALVARPLDDAEALAARGAFGPAIHALLLRTLEALVQRAAVPLPDSLTSREILAAVGLPEAPRAALGHLVSAVEISFFGGQAPSEGDYLACRERFHAFAAAFREAA